MGRYDKYDGKVGGFRAVLAADWAVADLNKIFGVGLDSSGRVVKGAGQTGVIGVIILTKARKAGEIVDVMTNGEIVEFGPTFGTAGVDFGAAGTAYYSQAANDEVQTITITGTPDGGNFTLTYKGETTANIAHSANAAAVKTALDNLSNIDSVTCGGGALPATPVTVTFSGDLVDDQGQPLMTADGAGLTGGTNPAVAVTRTTPGHAGGDVSATGATGDTYVGHTAEAQRLIVRVKPGALA